MKRKHRIAGIVTMAFLLGSLAGLPAWASQENPSDSPLYGQKALYVGDSISFGAGDTAEHRGWAGRIGTVYSMDTDNRSISGTSLSTCRSGRIISQLTSAKHNSYDYVILHGGVNDAWDSAEVGEMSASFSLSSFDTSTYAGGLEELFYHAVRQFPKAKIGYIFNFHITLNSGRLADMSEYYATAKQICEKWGIPYLDLYFDDNINNNVLQTGTTTYLPDLVHPNAAGYDRLSPYIASWMETLPSCDTVIPLENAKPLFSLDSGIYDGTQTVEILSPVPGADIYYTLDGTYPSPSKQKYTAPISLGASTASEHCYLRAVAVKDGKMSQVEECQYTFVPTDSADSTILDTSSLTDWQVTGGGTWTAENGKIIQSDNDTAHVNWARSLTYTKKQYTNFVAEATFQFKITDPAAWGFIGIGVRKPRLTDTQNDKDSGFCLSLEPKGRAFVWVPQVGEAGGTVIPDFDITRPFKMKIMVLGTSAYMSINDTQVLTIQNDLYAENEGYLSIHAGLLPIEVSNFKITEISNDSLPVEQAVDSIEPVSDRRVAYNTGLEEVLSTLPEKVKVTDTVGNLHSVDITWTCEGYNPQVSGDYTFTGALSNLPDGLVNAYGHSAAAVVHVDEPLPDESKATTSAGTEETTSAPGTEEITSAAAGMEETTSAAIDTPDTGVEFAHFSLFILLTAVCVIVVSKRKACKGSF